MKRSFCLWLMLICLQVYAQKNFKEYGILIKTSSSFNMFPDSLRNVEPRIYQGKIYPSTTHFQDSSILVFIPKHFKQHKSYEIIFWCHGWYNTIDSTIQSFELIEQFTATKRNAILVFPEAAKNAPDSYAGKFERPEYFNLFMNDLIAQLIRKNILLNKSPRKLILAGHSGAYKALSYILQYSAFNTQSVLLFDGLYGREDVFMEYLTNHPSFQFINVYTNNGGTKALSETFINNIHKGWRYKNVTEDALTDKDIKRNKILFIHSTKEHNSVMHLFERFLKNIR